MSSPKPPCTLPLSSRAPDVVLLRLDAPARLYPEKRLPSADPLGIGTPQPLFAFPLREPNRVAALFAPLPVPRGSVKDLADRSLSADRRCFRPNLAANV